VIILKLPPLGLAMLFSQLLKLFSQLLKIEGEVPTGLAGALRRQQLF
jgi:hypothetical protein